MESRNLLVLTKKGTLGIILNVYSQFLQVEPVPRAALVAPLFAYQSHPKPRQSFLVSLQVSRPDIPPGGQPEY